MLPSEMTPSEIDAELAWLYPKHQSAARQLAYFYEQSREATTSDFRQVRREEAITRYEARVAELRSQMEPLEAEYNARRWNRAFLVTNANGHIHSSMHCTTCFPDTQYAWIPELSGKTEAEIIEHAGMKACTICYPNAPVAKMTNAERKNYAKAEVEARKAEKAEIKRQKELAKIPRQHALALKIDELVEAYGTTEEHWGEAYRATYPGERFGKGYDTAFSVWHDMATKRSFRPERVWYEA